MSEMTPFETLLAKQVSDMIEEQKQLNTKLAKAVATLLWVKNQHHDAVSYCSCMTCCSITQTLKEIAE